MKYWLSVIIACFVVFHVQAADLTVKQIPSKAFVLMDAGSGRVLQQHRATERLAPASITKLMTAYVVYKTLATGGLAGDDTTVISATARQMTEGSRMFLEKGSRVSIDQLLHGLVIQSGNDAAIALAEAVAGSEAAFVKIMNATAAEMGLTDSHFKNVTGLTEDGHYMSAHNIATLAQAIIRDFPEHYKLYKEKSYTWNNISQNNRNALLRTDATVDGLKTGYTEAAGYCLTASAKRDGMRLISVVLGTKSVGARARASKKILDYGFSQYRSTTLYRAEQPVVQVNVKNAKQDKVAIVAEHNITLPLTAAEAKDVRARLVLQKPLTAPLDKRQQVGYFSVALADKVLLEVPAKTHAAVEQVGFFKRLWNSIVESIKVFFNWLWQALGIGFSAT